LILLRILSTILRDRLQAGHFSFLSQIHIRVEKQVLKAIRLTNRMESNHVEKGRYATRYPAGDGLVLWEEGVKGVLFLLIPLSLRILIGVELAI